MLELEILFTEYATRYWHGDLPRAADYIGRAGADSEALDAVITAFVGSVTAPAPTPAALARDVPAGLSMDMSSALALLKDGEPLDTGRTRDEQQIALKHAAELFRESSYVEAEIGALRAIAVGAVADGKLSQAGEILAEALARAEANDRDDLALRVSYRLAETEAALGNQPAAAELARRVVAAGSRDPGPEESLEGLLEAARAGLATGSSVDIAGRIGPSPSEDPRSRRAIHSLIEALRDLPAESLMERAAKLFRPVSPLAVSLATGRSTSDSHEAVSIIHLTARAGEDLGTGTVRVDRTTGRVVVRLDRVPPELVGSRPYLIFPLTLRSGSPRLEWSGLAAGLPEGVARPTDVVGDNRSLRVEVGVLSSPHADVDAMLGSFFVAGEGLEQIHVPFGGTS